MLKIHIIIKAILDRRTGRELRIGPYLRDRGCHHMGAGMAQPLQVAHAIALVEALSFRLFAFIAVHREVLMQKQKRLEPDFEASAFTLIVRMNAKSSSSCPAGPS